MTITQWAILLIAAAGAITCTVHGEYLWAGAFGAMGSIMFAVEEWRENKDDYRD